MQKFRYILTAIFIGSALIISGCGSSDEPGDEPPGGTIIETPDDESEPEADAEDNDEENDTEEEEFLDVDDVALPADGFWEITHYTVVLNCTGEDSNVDSPTVQFEVESENLGIEAVFVFDGTGYINATIDDNRPSVEMRLESFTDEVYSIVFYDDSVGEELEFYIYSPNDFPFGYNFYSAIEVPGAAMTIDYYIKYNADVPNMFTGLILSFVEGCTVHRPISGKFLGSID